eukprot:284815671_2
MTLASIDLAMRCRCGLSQALTALVSRRLLRQRLPLSHAWSLFSSDRLRIFLESYGLWDETKEQELRKEAKQFMLKEIKKADVKKACAVIPGMFDDVYDVQPWNIKVNRQKDIIGKRKHLGEPSGWVAVLDIDVWENGFVLGGICGLIATSGASRIAKEASSEECPALHEQVPGPRVNRQVSAIFCASSETTTSYFLCFFANTQKAMPRCVFFCNLSSRSEGAGAKKRGVLRSNAEFVVKLHLAARLIIYNVGTAREFLCLTRSSCAGTPSLGDVA